MPEALQYDSSATPRWGYDLGAMSEAPDLARQWAASFGADPDRRQWAESFGSDAERYDRARPRYPDALIERIVAGGPAATCWTAARRLQGTGRAAVPRGGLHSARGRRRRADGRPRARIGARGRGGGVRGLGTRRAGEFWNVQWPARRRGTGSTRSPAQPTRRGRSGRTAGWRCRWNMGRPPPGVAEAFGAGHRRVMPDLKYLHGGGRSPLDAYSTGFTRAADGIREAGAFGEPEQWRFDWERSSTRPRGVARPGRHPRQGQLPPQNFEEILAGIATAIDAAGARSRWAIPPSSSLRLGGGPLLAPVVGGSEPELALERLAERVLRAVADPAGDRLKRRSLVWSSRAAIVMRHHVR